MNKCQICSKEFDKINNVCVKLTECNSLVCQSHIDSNLDKCLIEGHDHFIDAQKCLDLAENYSILNQQKEKLKNTLEVLELSKNDPEHLIYEHFSNLKETIDLRETEIISKINDHFDKLRKTIKIEQEKSVKQLEYFSNLNDQKEITKTSKIVEDSEFSDIQELEKLNENYESFNKFLKRKKSYYFDVNTKNLKLETLLGSIKIENIKNQRNKTLYGHQGSVFCLGIINKFDIVSTRGKLISIWELSKSNLEEANLRDTITNDFDITCLKITDSNEILIGDENGTIKIWNRNSKKCLQTFIGHTQKVTCLEILDNKMISASMDKTLKIWNRLNGECLKSFPEETSSLLVLDVGILITTSLEKIKIWDLIRYECEKTINESVIITCSALMNTGQIAVGYKDGCIKIWDLFRSECVETLLGHTNEITYLKISENGDLFSCSSDRTTKIWDSFGYCLHSLANKNPVRSIHFLDSETFVSFSNDCQVWKKTNGNFQLPINVKNSNLGSIIAILNSTNIISGSSDYKIKIWEAVSGECSKTLNEHTDLVRCLDIVNENQIISGSYDQNLKLWSIRTGECLQTHSFDDPIISLRVLKNLNEIVFSLNSENINIWNFQEKRFKFFKNLNHSEIGFIELKNNLILSAFENKIKIWDKNDGKLFRKYKLNNFINCIQFYNDNEILVGYIDGAIELFDIFDFKSIKLLLSHSDWISCIEVLKDGKICSGSYDGKIKIWNLDDGICIRTLEGHKGPINCLKILDTGELVSGSSDKTIKIWSLNSLDSNI